MITATVHHSKILLVVNQKSNTCDEDLCETLIIDVNNVMYIQYTVVLLKILETGSLE